MTTTTDVDVAAILKDGVVDQGIAFHLKTFTLQALIEKAVSVVPTRDILPVLKNFYVVVADGYLKIAATDLELALVASTGAVSVVRTGTAVLPARRLQEIVKEAESGDLQIDVVDSTAHITSGRTHWNLKLMDGSEYPPLPDVGEIEFTEIDKGKFTSALGAVRYAAATDTVRANLMMVDISGGRMRAADGVRFQQVVLGDVFPLDAQIPIGAVDNLMKILKASEATTFEVGEDEASLIFRIGNDIFVANKLTAVFPDVDEVLLKPALLNDQELHVDRQELISAIKRVRIVADAESSAVALSLSPEKVLVSAKDKYGSDATEELDVHWSGKDRTVAFNHEHLLQMLNMAGVSSCHFFLGVDKKTKPSPLMLKDDSTGMVGILNQIRLDFIS